MSNDKPTAAPTDDELEAELAALSAAEETIPVVLAVPNGVEIDGRLTLVPTTYKTTLTAVMAAQTILADGPIVDTAGTIARATDRIASLVDDAEVAAAIALRLAQCGLMATV